MFIHKATYAHTNLVDPILTHHFRYNLYQNSQIYPDQLTLVTILCIIHKQSRGSYSGNTLAFQANADSSILLPRSIFNKG